MQPYYTVQFNQKNKKNFWDYLPEKFDNQVIKIGLIDTGIDMLHDIFQIPNLHYRDFTNTQMKDDYGHGTHCGSLILSCIESQYLDSTHFYFAKAFTFGVSKINVERNIISALRWMQEEQANIILITVCTTQICTLLTNCIRKILQQKNTILIAPAGNYDISTPIFPASIDGVICISALDRHGLKIEDFYSGGYVDAFVSGEHIKGALPYNQFGTKTGTSQAAALFTGMLTNAIYSQIL